MRAVTVLAILFASFCLASEQHQANIEGYPSGGFAAKDAIEQELNNRVVAPLSTEMSEARGGKDQLVKVTLTVIGYADRVGINNDSLAKQRAEEVREFLAGQFPDASIHIRSKGDELNVRMVTVKWEVNPLVVAKTDSRTQSAMIVRVAITILSCLGVCFAAAITVLVFRSRKVTDTQLASPSKVLVMPSSNTEDEFIEEVRMGDVVYSMTVFFRNGVYETPFPNKDGNGCMTKKDRDSVMRSFKNFLNSSAGRPKIEALIAKNKIQTRKVA